MSPWKSAQPGDPASAIDTPALVLDLDAFERNVQRMADALRDSQVRLRAHAKSHKCPEIALRQVAAGAIGICCQKVSEAAVFVDAGIGDILVTNQVMGDAKLRRLAPLARRARIGVLVDHPLQVQALAAAAVAHDVTLDTYVEVNVGANRCGVAPGDAAVQLARQIAASPGLQRPDLRYVKAADEHGVLETPDAAALSIGDVLMLVPGHCDPTVNLYDELVCVRGGRVEALWPVAARGALL